MEYSLKNLSFCSFLLVEGFEQGALRKELTIVPSIKHFKAVIWGQKQPPEMFCKKDVVKILANFTGKHVC